MQIPTHSGKVFLSDAGRVSAQPYRAPPRGYRGVFLVLPRATMLSGNIFRRQSVNFGTFSLRSSMYIAAPNGLRLRR